MGVEVDAEIFGRDAPLGSHRCGFREHQSGAADGTRPEIDEMPVVGKPVVAGVLAHRRDDDAVGQGDAAADERVEE